MSSPLSSLNAALAALAEDDAARAVHHLVAAWRASRAPRIADLVDAAHRRMQAQLARAPRDPVGEGGSRAAQAAWLAVAAEGDVADFDRLMASLPTGNSRLAAERLDALDDGDPRLARALVALVEAPPFTASTTRPFWRALIAKLEAIGDVRIVAALEELSQRYIEVVPTVVGELLQPKLGKLARALAARPVPALSPAEEAACAALEARLSDERAQAGARDAQARAGRRTHADFLRAVWDAPDDDGVREVYGDWLLERGEPRGELIQIQFARARGVVDAAQAAREAELLARHHDAFTDGLAAAVGAGRWERGFLEAATVWRNKGAVPVLTGHPAWATVRRLAISGTPDAALERQLVALIASPAMRSLVEVLNLSPAQLRAIVAESEGARRALRHVGLRLRVGEALDGETRATLAALPSLETLTVAYGLPPTGLVGDPLVARLGSLRLVPLRADTLAPVVGELARAPLRELVVMRAVDGLRPEGWWGVCARLFRGPEGRLDALTVEARSTSYVPSGAREVSEILGAIPAALPSRIAIAISAEGVGVTPDERAAVRAAVAARFPGRPIAD